MLVTNIFSFSPDYVLKHFLFLESLKVDSVVKSPGCN